MNLIEGLQKELDRNKELVKLYEGHFAAKLIQNDIIVAEAMMACGDTIGMIRAYKALAGNSE